MGGGSTSMRYDKQWEADKELYDSCRMLLQELNLNDEIYFKSLANGLADGFMNVIAQYLANPFRSRKKLIEWVSNQLCDPVWSACTQLFDSEKFQAIKERNVETLILQCKERYKASQLFYTAMLFMRYL